jgi:hypothetical protein
MNVSVALNEKRGPSHHVIKKKCNDINIRTCMFSISDINILFSSMIKLIPCVGVS